jgi:1,4-dihydroxy-2-naphthoate octaprenyltransferase
MDAGQATAMQMQIRQNAADLEDFMKGLDSWEEEIKEKDKSLTKQKPILKEVCVYVTVCCSRLEGLTGVLI